jgi:signal transduction histidine kinase
MSRLSRALIVVIVLFTISAIGVFAVIVDRHMKLQVVNDSVATAALRTGIEFRDFEQAVRDLARSPDAAAVAAAQQKYDILYSRLDLMTAGYFGTIYNESEKAGQKLRDLKVRVYALAPQMDALRPDSIEQGKLLLGLVSSLSDDFAYFRSAGSQLQSRLDDAARSELLRLYAGLAAVFAVMVMSVGGFVWLLIRQFRIISASNVELRSLSAQLAEAKVEADTANRAKSHFLAVMSHELRTPLNAIIGFSELIADELFGPVGNGRYKEYARDIHQSGSHLLNLVNDVLDLSRIEAGRYELCEEICSLDELVESCFSVMQAAAQKGVRLSHADLREAPKLRADGRAVRQMLLNLMSNAVKFTPAGGIVHVDLRRGSDGGLVIEVRDTGIGMTPEAARGATQPFNHVSSQVARDHKGAGLGLSITKQLIELHGGMLSIESAVGVGTAVMLSVPPSRIPAAPARPSDMAA